MTTTGNDPQTQEQFGTGTRALAGFCHKCGVCPFADKKPDSTFGRVMRWHRTWCPGSAAHTRVYGRKDLS